MKNTLKNESFSGSVIIDLKDNILKYLNDRIYMLFVILTAVGSYGFLISHHTVGIDDLEYDFYYRGGLFAQGRITSTVVHWFFGLVKNQIWFLELIGILCFCLFTIMLCVIIDKFIKTKNHVPQIVFSCAFISYPLHSELFSYGGTSLAVGAGGCIMAIAMLFAMKYQDTKENKYLVFSALWALPMLSWYESVILLYVSIVLIILLSKQIKYNDYKFKNMFFEGLQYAIPLISAFIVEVLISGIVKNLPICKGIANSSANSLAWEFSSKEVF
ncbi:MAG: glucosyltransferase domain-containing protein, partial [Ruminococcus sp.]|nr:glucosyltransferase domain-containing protein [Candidatus Copronaster equi]